MDAQRKGWMQGGWRWIQGGGHGCREEMMGAGKREIDAGKKGWIQGGRMEMGTGRREPCVDHTGRRLAQGYSESLDPYNGFSEPQ